MAGKSKKPFMGKNVRPSAIDRRTKSSQISTAIREATNQEMLEKIQIEPELESYIAPLSEEEFGILEESILSERKVRDKLLVWKKNENQWILIDGHHRYKVLTTHPDEVIKFGVEEADVSSLEEAMVLMEEIQLGRRNATRNYMSYLRGRAYLREKGERGGDRKTEESAGSTREKVADRFKVGTATIIRDAELARGVDRFEGEDLPEEIQQERYLILRQESFLTKNALQFIGKYSDIDLELLIQFFQNGGTPEVLKDLPQEEWENVMKSFKGSLPPTASAPKKSSGQPAQKRDPFFSWYSREDKVIQKIAKKGDEEMINKKLEELDERLKHIQELQEMLKS